MHVGAECMMLVCVCPLNTNKHYLITFPPFCSSNSEVIGRIRTGDIKSFTLNQITILADQMPDENDVRPASGTLSHGL